MLEQKETIIYKKVKILSLYYVCPTYIVVFTTVGAHDKFKLNTILLYHYINVLIVKFEKHCD